jgi:hypothetical protein
MAGTIASIRAEITSALPTRPAKKTQLGIGVPRPRLRIPFSRSSVSCTARLWSVAEITARLRIAGT